MKATFVSGGGLTHPPVGHRHLGRVLRAVGAAGLISAAAKQRKERLPLSDSGDLGTQIGLQLSADASARARRRQLHPAAVSESGGGFSADSTVACK